jgi:low temperature requirement protein LtrA
LRDWVIEGGHLAERCGLFVIIALGESILVTGATFADLEWT